MNTSLNPAYQFFCFLSEESGESKVWEQIVPVQKSAFAAAAAVAHLGAQAAHLAWEEQQADLVHNGISISSWDTITDKARLAWTSACTRLVESGYSWTRHMASNKRDWSE